MLTLDDAVWRADAAFEAGLVLPPPNPDKQRRLEALTTASLTVQARTVDAEIRAERAAGLGMAERLPQEFAGMLMGARPDYGPREKILGRLEYVRHSSGLSPRYWFRDFVRFRRPRIGVWGLNLLGASWTVRMGPLDSLSQPIPYGVVLRIQELKALDVFDYFVGMAPIEAWRTAEETRAIDPLVLAVIGTGAAEDRHYLVARW